MNDIDKGEIERVMWENSLAFFGAITASVSHELNNVMSIIDQNNGLLKDLLAAVEYGRPISNERLERINNSITNQTERGVRIIKRLNRFAHSVDDPVREFDIIQLVDNFTRLAQRLASLKRVILESRHDDPQLSVTTSPFLVQQVLFICIQRSLNAAQSEDVIDIITEARDKKILLTVKGRSMRAIREGWDTDYIEQLMRLIDGNLEIISEGENEFLKITINQ